MSVEKISVSIQRDLAEKVDEYAEENDIPRSQVVNDALDDYFQPKTKESVWEEDVIKRLNTIESTMSKVLSKLGMRQVSEYKRSSEESAKAKSNRKAILTLLHHCRTINEDSRFEIDGEQGFINQVVQREIFGEDWTERELEKLAKDVKNGYDDYSFFGKPDRDELFNRLSGAMDLSDEQIETFREFYHEEFEEEEEQEEDWWS